MTIPAIEFVCPRCGFRLKAHHAGPHYCACSGDGTKECRQKNGRFERVKKNVATMTRMKPETPR